MFGTYPIYFLFYSEFAPMSQTLLQLAASITNLFAIPVEHPELNEWCGKALQSSEWDWRYPPTLFVFENESQKTPLRLQGEDVLFWLDASVGVDVEEPAPAAPADPEAQEPAQDDAISILEIVTPGARQDNDEESMEADAEAYTPDIVETVHSKSNRISVSDTITAMMQEREKMDPRQRK